MPLTIYQYFFSLFAVADFFLCFLFSLKYVKNIQIYFVTDLQGFKLYYNFILLKLSDNKTASVLFFVNCLFLFW